MRRQNVQLVRMCSCCLDHVAVLTKSLHRSCSRIAGRDPDCSSTATCPLSNSSSCHAVFSPRSVLAVFQGIVFVDFLLGWLDWRRNTSRSVYFSTLVSHLAVLVVNVVASNLLRVSHSCRLLRLDNPAAMAAECRSLLRFPALRLELPRKTPEINAQPALSESTYVRICELVCSHLVSASGIVRLHS